MIIPIFRDSLVLWVILFGFFHVVLSKRLEKLHSIALKMKRATPMKFNQGTKVCLKRKNESNQQRIPTTITNNTNKLINQLTN